MTTLRSSSSLPEFVRPCPNARGSVRSQPQIPTFLWYPALGKKRKAAPVIVWISTFGPAERSSNDGPRGGGQWTRAHDDFQRSAVCLVGQMAPSLPSLEPRRAPPAPPLVIPENGHGEPSFRFTCDDFDRDPAGSASARSPGSERFLADFSPNSPAGLLHPQRAISLRPPTPDRSFGMASEDAVPNGGSGSPAPKNPFNFQTQFISTGPVKSVCCRQHSETDLHPN